MSQLSYYTIKPGPALADLVRYFWVFEGDASSACPYTLRTVANGCPELLFHYRGKFNELGESLNAEPSFITGVHAQTGMYRRFSVHQPFGIFGVYLYPYALHSLFDIPAIEFTNQLLDLDSISKQVGDRISEKILTATNAQQRVAIISEFLIKQRKAVKRIEIAYAVRNIIHSKGMVDIKAISDQCFRSYRQFERNFKEETGFSAKTYARIIRFNASLGEYKNTAKSLTQMALDFGYYDQSHFIHDFKKFSGYSPGMYFSGRAPELL